MAAVPFELATEAGPLAFISMTAMFGTPTDITLSELAMKCFYPANDATARLLAAKLLARDQASAGAARAVKARISGQGAQRHARAGSDAPSSRVIRNQAAESRFARAA
ncbi:MAG: hypothetical protein ABSC06_13715 [Rhodopila sp.]|jgi:hypothetical protein